MSEYRFESEDFDGRYGVVIYTVPDNIQVTNEINASDHAVDVRWEFP